MQQQKRDLASYGYEALDRQSEKTNEFCAGKISAIDLNTISRSGGITAREMDSTLRVEKFNTFIKLATK